MCCYVLLSWLADPSFCSWRMALTATADCPYNLFKVPSLIILLKPLCSVRAHMGGSEGFTSSFSLSRTALLPTSSLLLPAYCLKSRCREWSTARGMGRNKQHRVGRRKGQSSQAPDSSKQLSHRLPCRTEMNCFCIRPCYLGGLC